MEQKIEVGPTKTQVVVNYHRHPLGVGCGHVSLEVAYEGATHKLSVYPEDPRLSPAFLAGCGNETLFIAPTLKAENHNSPAASDSPIEASYDITEHVPDIKNLIEEVQKLQELMDAGRATFSVLPGTLTKSATVLLHPESSASKIMLGLKTLDRECIDLEVEQFTVLNCAEAVSRVLKAGGMERPGGILSFASPWATNKHFDSMFKKNTTTEQCPEQIEAVITQNQTSATQEEPGWFSSIVNSVKNFFTPKETPNSSEKLTVQNTNSNDSDWSNNESSSTDKSEEVEEVNVHTTSLAEQWLATKDQESSSPRASEGLSFFVSNTPAIEAPKENQSELQYLLENDHMAYF